MEAVTPAKSGTADATYSCKHCGVTILPPTPSATKGGNSVYSIYSIYSTIHCPLCNMSISPEESPEAPPKITAAEIAYPTYSYGQKIESERVFTMQKLLFFLTVSACIISIFINIFTADRALFLWSLIVTVSLFSAWGIFKVLHSKATPIGLKLLALYGIAIVLTVTIDGCTGFEKWSTTYVIPFLTVALTLLFTAMASSMKKRFKEYLGYLIATFFISICPLLLFAFKLSTEVWTSLVALLSCVLSTLGLFIFSDDLFKEEIKKRFHF